VAASTAWEIRHYVFAGIEHANRRIRPLGATPHPTRPLVVQAAGIEVVLSGVRMPRMNSAMERWMRTCRREPLDRTLI